VSRSRRKTPIVGYSTARSEADDKRLWHKRWRARERDHLVGLRRERSGEWPQLVQCDR